MSRFVLLLTLAVSLVACKGGDGSRCVTSSDCADGEGCYVTPTGAQRCLARCDSASAVLCSGGELCVSVPGEDAADDVCLPGGGIAIGATCITSADCVKGAMCFASGGGAICRRACDQSGTPACLVTESCSSVDPDAGATRGACVPL
jgi:hypothetical protein